MWQVRFRDDFHDEPVTIYAEDVDFSDMPLVYVRGIRKKYRSATIIIPDSDTWNEICEFDPLIIPYNNLSFAGRIKEEAAITKLETVKAGNRG